MMRCHSQRAQRARCPQNTFLLRSLTSQTSSISWSEPHMEPHPARHSSPPPRPWFVNCRLLPPSPASFSWHPFCSLPLSPSFFSLLTSPSLLLSQQPESNVAPPVFQNFGLSVRVRASSSSHRMEQPRRCSLLLVSLIALLAKPPPSFIVCSALGWIDI